MTPYVNTCMHFPKLNFGRCKSGWSWYHDPDTSQLMLFSNTHSLTFPRSPWGLLLLQHLQLGGCSFTPRIQNQLKINNEWHWFVIIPHWWILHFWSILQEPGSKSEKKGLCLTPVRHLPFNFFVTLLFQIPAKKVFWGGFWGPNTFSGGVWKPRVQ